MNRKEAQDSKNLKYYLGCSHMIYMNGEPDKYTNLMHVFNTFLDYFWSSNFAGAYWALDNCLMMDVQDTQTKFIEVVNKSDNKTQKNILNFIKHIKPSINVRKSKTYAYPKQMTYFGKGHEEYGMHPQVLFEEIMKLLKHDSYQETLRKEFKNKGLAYINVSSS